MARSRTWRRSQYPSRAHRRVPLERQDPLRVYALVPAAGRGHRFGGDKLLAKWHDRPLLGHVLLKLGGARAAGLIVGTVVVHRPSDEATRRLALDYRCRPLAARHEDGELSYTLRYGIEMIAARGPAQEKDAILICLADQPMLRLDVIRTLIDAWKAGGTRVVRPSYREAPGEPGHPLLIDRSLWGHAAEMRGESGFAPVIESRRIPVKTISVAGRNPDVDTAADLEAIAAAAEVGEH